MKSMIEFRVISKAVESTLTEESDIKETLDRCTRGRYTIDTTGKLVVLAGVVS